MIELLSVVIKPLLNNSLFESCSLNNSLTGLAVLDGRLSYFEIILLAVDGATSAGDNPNFFGLGLLK